MIESLIFLTIITWAFVVSLYAIDLQTDKENLEARLTIERKRVTHWQKVAAQAVFTANALGDEDRDRPLNCYTRHAALYGEKENA